MLSTLGSSRLACMMVAADRGDMGEMGDSWARVEPEMVDMV